MKRTKITLLAVAGLVFALVPAAQAATFDWTGGVSSEWTVDGNWDIAGFPNAIGDVANFGITAAVNVSAPVTVGQITDTGAGNETFLNSLTATGNGAITFDNGGSGALFRVAQLHHRDPNNSTYSVPMVLDDDLEIRYGTQRTRNFDGPISGTKELTWNLTFSNQDFTIGGASPNTYQGGTIIDGSANTTLKANKDGAFGSGDVTMTANSVLNITDGGATDDRIDDSASLYMEKEAIDGYSVLTLDTNVSETVGGLYFNNVLQATGTWGATGSGAVNINDDYFSGDGVLNVVPTPGSSSQPFAITEIDYDPDADPPTVTLTWRSRPGTTYKAPVSSDLSDWGFTLASGLDANNDENTEDGAHITVTFPLNNDLKSQPDLFFRIEEEEQPQ